MLLRPKYVKLCAHKSTAKFINFYDTDKLHLSSFVNESFRIQLNSRPTVKITILREQLYDYMYQYYYNADPKDIVIYRGLQVHDISNCSNLLYMYIFKNGFQT